MNSTDEENVLKFIEKIFEDFLVLTQSTTPQFSRDYFERFTQLLNQTFVRYSQHQSSILQTISSLSYPYHSSNLLTFEYQLRLIRYAFRQHLNIVIFQKENFLDELFRHPLLRQSSILRHLALQIAITIYEQDLQQNFDEQFFIDLIRLFSPDPNLYVRNTLVEFLALYLSKHDQCKLIQEIRRLSTDSDLIYQIFIRLNPNEQEGLLQQLNLFDRLADTPAQRVFVLKTAKYLIDEDPIIFYLNRIFEKSLSDYIHMLLTIVSSRETFHRSNEKLKTCLKAVFLYIQDTEIEEIDETESNILANQDEPFGELTEYICCRLYERNIEPRTLASIVLDAIQPLIIHPDAFLYQLDFYAPTIMKMLNGENREEKTFAQLIICLDQLHGSNTENFDEMILAQVQKKKRSTLVYQAFFDYIIHSTNRTVILEKVSSIVEVLLFEKLDPLFQWDNQDCVLHFLKQLPQTCPVKWFTTEFLRRIVEQFVHNTNEYIQGSLIDLLASLVEQHQLSPFDHYLTSNFIQLTEYSLGDVVRCALAHAWFILLTQSNRSHQDQQYQFSFGTNIERNSLPKIISEQIPLLIGDGGQQTEVQCLRLIESLETRTEELNKVLEFLYNDGCSNEIKEHAGRLLGRTREKKINDILEDEFQAILHWFEHPDEHMVLDCD